MLKSNLEAQIRETENQLEATLTPAQMMEYRTFRREQQARALRSRPGGAGSGDSSPNGGKRCGSGEVR
ncbi:MAG: hypothetical protein C0617_13170 [Desulfuromonas sp.]|nr:MAG: hypothetical protein C0617_13170 [Desulfuromonas sp.]